MSHQVSFTLKPFCFHSVYLIYFQIATAQPDTTESNSCDVLFCSYAAVSQRPVYPSSKPAKDWDKLESEAKKQVPLLAPEPFPYFTFTLISAYRL